VREHKVAVASSEVSGDEDEREKDVSRKPMVLVESTGRVSVRLACLGCNETDQTLYDYPGDDGETHLAVSRNEMRGAMDVFVVDDGRHADEQQRERKGKVDNLVLAESSKLLSRALRARRGLQGLYRCSRQEDSAQD
jgi:hypothetical protein